MILPQSQPQPFSLIDLKLVQYLGDGGMFALRLLWVLVLGHGLGWHFVRYAQVLSNKKKLARVLVFIAVTTMLIISVVKTSLALSLGLVGALSIIRFRTPVKEPEELAYLFLAIALGLGFAAEQEWVTAVVFLVVLLVMALRSGLPGGRSPLRTVLQVVAGNRAAGGDTLRQLVPEVSSHCQRVELRRVDCHGGEFHASLLVELQDVEGLQALIDGVQQVLPGASVSVVERDSLD